MWALVSLNIMGASLSCSPASGLGPFLVVSHFYPSSNAEIWELACPHFTVSTLRPREVKLPTQQGRDSAGFESWQPPLAASVLIPKCYITQRVGKGLAGLCGWNQASEFSKDQISESNPAMPPGTGNTF